MRLVEKNEAVIGDETRIHRPRTRATPVGSEQQAGADLIDGGRHDGRLQRIARPGLRAVHPPAQRVDGQRAFIAEADPSTIGEVPESVRDRLQDPVFRLFQLLRQTPSPVMGFVDDDPSVYHEEDAARGGHRTARSEAGGLRGECEHGDVQAGGLAGPRRECDCVRPRPGSVNARRGWIGARYRRRVARSIQHPLGQSGLPCKGHRPLPPKRGEEAGEVRVIQLSRHRAGTSSDPCRRLLRDSAIEYGTGAHRKIQGRNESRMPCRSITRGRRIRTLPR